MFLCRPGRRTLVGLIVTHGRLARTKCTYSTRAGRSAVAWSVPVLLGFPKLANVLRGGVCLLCRMSVASTKFWWGPRQYFFSLQTTLHWSFLRSLTGHVGHQTAPSHSAAQRSSPPKKSFGDYTGLLKITRAHQEMRYPYVTWRIISYGYLLTTELGLRHIWTWTPEYFWNKAYMSNRRRFTKSALCILLLSTFRLSSINYSLVCIVFRFVQEAPLTQKDREPTVSWIRVKCCTDRLHLKRLQPVNNLQGHPRSLPWLPFGRPYTISYYSSTVSISLSCTVFEILTLICQKN